MKCREVEKRIYLYEELTTAERKLVDDHINQCEACSKLIEQVFRSQTVIKKAKLHQPELQNPHRLTQRVMNEIEQEKDQSFFKVWVTYLNSLLFRYAISTVSIFLIAFFIYEQQAIDQQSEVGNISKTEVQGAVLDLTKFHSAYNMRRENRPLEPLGSRYTFYKSERFEKKL
jgi:predicted anti-sigma-YlaC factor YlaD